MQIVEAMADADVLDASGRPTYRVRAGHRYVVHDREAGYGLRQAALRLIAGLDRRLPCYRGQPLASDRLILPFIGRMGDAIVTASCLSALTDRYPDVTVDIALPDAAREVFELFPPFGRLRPYPVEESCLAEYDYYLSFEAVDAIQDGSRRSCIDVFSACLKTPPPMKPVGVIVPSEARDRWRWLSSDRPGVAIHVGRTDSLRSYPRDLLKELVRRLAREELNVYLVGAAGATDRLADLSGDSVIDLVGRTGSCADLAAVLAMMQVVVTGDSFPLHLAGALGIPTVAIFTATDAVIGRDYPSVIAFQSQASCSPCRAADGACPLGHGECIAHRDPSVDPDHLVACIHTVVRIGDREPAKANGVTTNPQSF